MWSCVTTPACVTSFSLEKFPAPPFLSSVKLNIHNMPALARPNRRVHEAKPFLQHTKVALEQLIQIITLAIKNGYPDAKPLDDQKCRWQFPDALDKGKDVTQIFAMVCMIRREMEDGLQVFEEEYDEHINGLWEAASNLESYAGARDLDALKHLQTATSLIGDALEDI